MLKFGQECPGKPTIPGEQVIDLRAKIELEETLELLIDGLGISCIQSKSGENFNLMAIKSALKDGAKFHKYMTPSIKEVADACSDKSVVNYGTLIAFGLLGSTGHPINYYGQCRDPYFDEVMRSNFSKMWTSAEVNSVMNNMLVSETVEIAFGNLVARKVTDSDVRCWLVKDISGKVIKSPSYSPANLQPIIDSFKS